jgi:hypothetical protein
MFQWRTCALTLDLAPQKCSKEWRQRDLESPVAGDWGHWPHLVHWPRLGPGLLRLEAALSNMCMIAPAKCNWSTVALFHHTATVSLVMVMQWSLPLAIYGLTLTLTRRRLHWSQPWRDLVCARRGGISGPSEPLILTSRLRASRDMKLSGDPDT